MVVVGGGGGFRCSWPCCLCACRLLLWLWFAVGVCVCGAVRARVVSVLVCGAWFVVCGVRRWRVGRVVAGVWCGWSLATPGGGSCVLLPATPGWGFAAGSGVWWVVCGVWCVVCGGGVLVGLWLVCGVVGPSPLLAEVPVCYSSPLLVGFRCRWWWAVLATPG